MLNRILSCLLLLLLCSCEEPASQQVDQSPQVIRPSGNPNGDSELALLMRDLFDSHMDMRKALMQGEKPDLPEYLANIHTAEATEPEKAASAAYKSMGDAYLIAARQYQDASIAEAPEAYTLMVNQCLNCHQSMCPGPMSKIKKLKLPKSLSVQP